VSWLTAAALLLPSAAYGQNTPPAPNSSPPPSSKPLGSEAFWPWVLPPEGIASGAYVQGQYENHQESQDQLNQSGSALNLNRFSIRRARVSLTGEWEYAALALELDANTTNGPQVDLRKAEASLQYRPDRNAPPLVMATMGLFDAPFGYEIVESPKTRWFMERSFASRQFFPAEPDLGFRLAGALGFFRWTISAQNGEPLGEASPYVLQDPNDAKDVIFRFGFDDLPLKDLHMAGGVSALHGMGFHPGNLPSGASLQWHDLSGDGLVHPAGLTGLPAQAGAPSQNFDRWAVGADFRASFRWWPGVAKVYAEFVLAQNLDRGPFYAADPISIGLAQRELGFYAAAVQEVTRYGVIGLRYDYYDPNSNAFDKRGGTLIPFAEAVKTVSPLVGLVLPDKDQGDRARLLLQYDIISNAFARSSLGVPTSLADNVWTLRLQVKL
jgi:hypothetical protein